MRANVAVLTVLPVLLAAGCADSRDDGTPTTIERIKETGQLWGIREIRLNTEGSVTLFDAKHAGLGCGLVMFGKNRERVDEITLTPGQNCDLSDGHHASLEYEYLGSRDGKLSFRVTDHFDARSFGGRVTKKTGEVSLLPYAREDKPLHSL